MDFVSLLGSLIRDLTVPGRSDNGRFGPLTWAAPRQPDESESLAGVLFLDNEKDGS
jgi:hypothetical protein